jgi:citronellol/citronellal dehydrogenase
MPGWQEKPMSLKGKTLFVTGASRGIGLAIARRAAEDGANIAIIAKTTEPHPKLPGTIYSAAQEVIDAGGNALAIPTDIRIEDQVTAAVARTIDHFGGIDVLVNNASAIAMTGTLETSMKRFDLMFGVNVRGTFLCSQACLPALKESARLGRQPHILNLSPPLTMHPKWLGPHVAYTMAKYGMSMCALGMAEEFRKDGIAVNALWPRTIIDTAALQVIPGALGRRGRTPQIMADAAYIVLNSGLEISGRILIDDEVLRSAGVSDFSKYAVTPGNTDLLQDLFL